jgi:hypothetical protein
MARADSFGTLPGEISPMNIGKKSVDILNCYPLCCITNVSISPQCQTQSLADEDRIEAWFLLMGAAIFLPPLY